MLLHNGLMALRRERTQYITTVSTLSDWIWVGWDSHRTAMADVVILGPERQIRDFANVLKTTLPISSFLSWLRWSLIWCWRTHEWWSWRSSKIHAEAALEGPTWDFMPAITSRGLSLNLTGPTYCGGCTLDLIFSIEQDIGGLKLRSRGCNNPVVMVKLLLKEV